MSEAEKTVDVEDVLSSIRRLVADGPRILPEHPKPAFVAEPEAVQPEQADTEPETLEPTPDDAADPVSFVDTMNASIAEITETNVENHIEEPVSEVEARAADIDAFLANETAQPPESETIAEEIVADAIDKSEPFVLRADMARDFDSTETTSDTAPETQSNAQEEDKEEISFHDTLEDDEAFLDSFEDDEITEEESLDANSAPEASLFDEEALREIVSELVRAELQGDLGDRITRNVRKLVRREIHHALATRDFE